jgi:pyruvate/2-oxoglutarate dehydrogenase complex dihydrolipoamide dehydrogenase (E3) component
MRAVPGRKSGVSSENAVTCCGNTGCVPSKALIAAAPMAHNQRIGNLYPGHDVACDRRLVRRPRPGRSHAQDINLLSTQM